MNMTKKARICQYVVLAYLAWLVVAGLLATEKACAAYNVRSIELALLVLAVRYWFFWKVAQLARAWVRGLGIFFIFGALLGEPAWIYFRAHQIVFKGPYTWSPLGFLINEVALIVCAICCFILVSELGKGPLKPTPLSAASPAGHSAGQKNTRP